MTKSKWIVKCEEIIDRHHPSQIPKHTLKQIMEVLENHGFLDTDWKYECEPEGYFDE